MPQFVSLVYIVAFLLLSLYQLTPILAQSCYFPDGTTATADTPCNGTASASHCCEKGGACLSSGLCYQAYDQSINTGTCTDKSWKDPSCFQQCPTSADYQVSNTNTLYRCDLNYWCCSAGGNETSCCNDPNVSSFDIGRRNLPAVIYKGSAWASGFTIAPVQALKTQSSISTPSSTTVNQPNSIGGNLSSATACRNCTSSPNPTTVGIGVGLGIGIPLLVALGSVSFLLLRERRRSRYLTRIINEGHQSGDQGPYNDISASKNGKAESHLLSSYNPAELEGIGMQGEAQFHELSSREGSQSKR